ncbi:hypothetical protein AAD001_16815 [Colwelliaceae bacterium 6471]
MMIILDKYNGNTNELLRGSTFREFNLPIDGADYTTNSLGIIYDMYCRWLQAEFGISFVEFNLRIPDNSGARSELVLDSLFHTVQENIKHRKSCSHNSTGFIWKSYREGFSTIHKGYFFIPIIRGEIENKPEGNKNLLSKDILEIIGKIMSQDKEHFTEDVGLYLVTPSEEGRGGVLCNSSFEAKEQAFARLCDIAKIYIEEQNYEPPLFTARIGYGTPTRSFHNALSW